MAREVKLSVQTRPQTGRPAVKKLKAQGAVPAVIYGGREEPQSLQIAKRDIQALLNHAVGENILVELEINDQGKTTSRLALIQEVQHNPLGGAVLHVDFHAISANETIQANIPIEAVGEAIGVKSFGGILEQSIRALEIECLPKDLPEIILVDVANLNIGDSIHVKNITLPAGVTPLADPGLTVFLVAAPAVEEEKPAEVAATEPEVIKEKKPEAAAAEEKPGDKKEKSGDKK